MRGLERGMLLAIGIMWGVCATLVVPDAVTKLALRTVPVELTEAERHAPGGIVQTIQPLRVEIEFEDAIEFHRKNPSTHGPTYTINGTAAPYVYPCKITLPDGGIIIALPAAGLARFEGDLSGTIAHELLHCIRGKWHPE